MLAWLTPRCWRATQASGLLFTWGLEDKGRLGHTDTSGIAENKETARNLRCVRAALQPHDGATSRRADVWQQPGRAMLGAWVPRGREDQASGRRCGSHGVRGHGGAGVHVGPGQLWQLGPRRHRRFDAASAGGGPGWQERQDGAALRAQQWQPCGLRAWPSRPACRRWRRAPSTRWR